MWIEEGVIHRIATIDTCHVPILHYIRRSSPFKGIAIFSTLVSTIDSTFPYEAFISVARRDRTRSNNSLGLHLLLGDLLGALLPLFLLLLFLPFVLLSSLLFLSFLLSFFLFSCFASIVRWIYIIWDENSSYKENSLCAKCKNLFISSYLPSPSSDSSSISKLSPSGSSESQL